MCWSSLIKSIKSIEIFIGIFVILIVILIGWNFTSDYFAQSKSKFENYQYYYANFSDIDGLVIGSDVKIGGVKVGELISYEIDKSYKIMVYFSVSDKYKISDDSSLIVATTGFIGQRYLKLSPGSSENFLKNDDEILFTQSAINIETVLALLKK
jgi:phospholipid/cholesterol/gamma-HCH transport system substrate-binding protein